MNKNKNRSGVLRQLTALQEMDSKTLEDKILRNLTVREVMEDMETLVQIKYSHRYGQLYTETNPIQRQIMETFGVTIPT